MVDHLFRKKSNHLIQKSKNDYSFLNNMIIFHNTNINIITEHYINALYSEKIITFW